MGKINIFKLKIDMKFLMTK